MRLHEAISGAATRLSATWLLPLTSIAAALMFQICLAGPATVDDPYEEMLGNVEQESDYLLLINNLDTILKQPINLLEADREELGRLPWVSPWLADEIISLRRRGELKRIEDLKRISSVDEVLIELLRPFVEVRPPVRRDTPRLEGMLRARVVSQPASGTYRNLKTYLRTQLGYAGWEGGFILEKDRYESMLNDFQSFYLEKAFEARCLGRGRVIGGDFLLASGHGLVFSNPYGYSPSTVDPWRFSQGDFAIKPYTSVEENFGFSGAGLGLSRDNLGLCIAVSSARYDASLDEDGRVKSLGTSGLHVSEHEQEGKQALKEDLLGLAFQVSSAKAEGRSRGQGPIWRAGI
ncbi:MAG: helix-hairpin-helix domain-containing protein, partial [bacterium]